ncbi:thioredoxin domain-containing protein [candidate division WWE3 bacterium]|nr:thioredoxin domain-containing protein [candidate division WWE3 bacterium]
MQTSSEYPKFKLTDNFSIILVLALIIGAFFMGKLSTQVEMLKEKAQNPQANTTPPAQQQPPEEVLGEVIKPDASKDHILGKSDAKFALIEYSDYECPYCQSFHPTAQKAISEYKDQLMWVFRHFPLSFHPQARPTAIASECVAKLGGQVAFWKFTDAMFEKANALTDKVREDGAVAAGIPLSTFKACLTDKAIEALVDEDLDGGTTAGINGTPGNILMNLETGETKLLAGAVPYATLKAAIDAMINKK